VQIGRPGHGASREKQKTMAYSVKQVALMSGVSVRTLHFYDEMGLLKPARLGANGYRFYEEPQLLMLQQILFYRELGIELKQIKKILGRANFEKVAALKSHRTVLEKDLSRTRRLIETIDKTIEHLKGTKRMKTEEMFVGFNIAAGKDRFGDNIKLGGEPNDCKVSGKDTDGAMCIFEFTGHGGGPRHLHKDQDEWIYIIEGEFEFVVGKKKIKLGAGESIFLPRNVPHVWACLNGKPGRIIDVYQPAGKMEDFFRAVTTSKEMPTREEVLNKSVTLAKIEAMHKLFEAHGLDLLGPPIGIE
jgi:DNA-binding transcriptional MerR regulator/quercetin dioxygenase-like cupin family protein